MPLNERGDTVRVRIVRVGRTVVDFVVQYEAYIDEEYRPLVRYDGRHDRPHRDLLDWNGETIEKRWATTGTTNNEALTDAIDDIRRNWEEYLDGFLRRRP
jgi:hypothetical protein